MSQAKMKIVVGFDGSEQSRDALRLAEALKGALEATLVVAYIDEIDPLVDTSLITAEMREQEYTELFAEAERELGDAAFERQRLVGSASRGLDQLAEQTDADLLVLGSTHRGRLGRALVGSTAQRLLSGAPCAVAVAPNGYRADATRIETVGVGYDGGDEAQAALAGVITIARATGAALRLVAAAPSAGDLEPGRFGVSAANWAAQIRDRLREQLGATAAQIGDELHVETQLEEGDPASVLEALSAEMDLLVVGSRGYGPARRTLVGGVSSKLVNTARCPVLVVPRADGSSRQLSQ